MVARFQYQVSEYETAEPAEDHTLSLRRASRVSTLHGRNWDHAVAWKCPSKKKKKPIHPIRNGLGWALGPHPSPSHSPADPIQSPSATRLDGQSAGHDDMTCARGVLSKGVDQAEAPAAPSSGTYRGRAVTLVVRIDQCKRVISTPTVLPVLVDRNVPIRSRPMRRMQVQGVFANALSVIDARYLDGR